MPEGKDLRKTLNKTLEPKTFFVSNHLTYIDFLAFTELYDLVTEFTDDQKNQFNNIFRWYKHIQNLPEFTEYLEKTKRSFVVDPALKFDFLSEGKKNKKQK